LLLLEIPADRGKVARSGPSDAPLEAIAAVALGASLEQRELGAVVMQSRV